MQHSDLNSIPVENYDLDMTLASGEVFCWKKINNIWYGSTRLGLLKLLQPEPNTILWQTYPQKNNYDIIKHYLDLDFNYNDFISKTKSDKYISEAIKKYKGLRIVQQDPFETIISFILSANNNIGSIRSSIAKLSAKLGKPITVDNMVFNLFPSMESIANSSIDLLRSTSVGYRAEYIKQTAQTLLENNAYSVLNTLDETTARELLMQLRGVGSKVADCVLCFSLGFDNVVPIDVWIGRVLNRYYNVDDKLSYVKMAAWAQQNLYGYASLAGHSLYEYIRNDK